MKPELKQCPFCGSKPTLFVDNYEQYGVMCEGCGMYLGVELECGVALHDGWKAAFDTLESAIGAWNRRKEIVNAFNINKTMEGGNK